MHTYIRPAVIVSYAIETLVADSAACLLYALT
jgi:hypothetical protein